jgi:hypothetical protein
MHRPLIIGIMIALSAMIGRAQETTVTDDGGMVTITAPTAWTLQHRVGHVSASMPMPGEVYPATVSVTIETVEGARKRLEMYAKLFYAELFAHEHQPQQYSERDTTLWGGKAKVLEYSQPYAGEDLRTQLIVSIDGATAYVVRLMWLARTTDAAYAQLRHVASTVRRTKR